MKDSKGRDLHVFDVVTFEDKWGWKAQGFVSNADPRKASALDVSAKSYIDLRGRGFLTEQDLERVKTLKDFVVVDYDGRLILVQAQKLTISYLSILARQLVFSTYEGGSLSAGTLARLRNGDLLLIGDVNCLLGECDCCAGLRKEDILEIAHLKDLLCSSNEK